jgi:outer membrane protein assembly factor BamA
MRLLLFFLAFGLPLIGFGQKKYTLTYRNNNFTGFIKHPQREFKDSTKALNYIYNLKKSAISKGFVLASIDTITYTSNHNANIYFVMGRKFRSVQLLIPAKELSFIRKHERINEKLIANLDFTPKEITSILSRIHNVYLNNGYPFASIKLNQHDLNNNELTANLEVVRGPYKEWKQIHIKGASKVSEIYISNLIGIRKGSPYNATQLKKIASRIEQVPFLEEVKPHELLFTENGCELYVYLKAIPISSFNGIIGLQPNPITDKLSFTGELNLKLLNLLNRGELLAINWQSIGEQTQSLSSNLNYPFLFNTPFGVDASFDLYKRDTSFLELNSTIGIQYFLKQGNYLKAYYQNLSNSILSGGANNPTYNKLGNVKTNYYGLSYLSTQVDYLPNPTRGYKIEVSSAAGSRESQLNDSAQVLKSLTFRGTIAFELFAPIAKRHTMRLANTTQYYSASNIFENEVYRFGGLNAQRGFNEDELFATTRTSSVLEYRFLLDRNSHVFAFADQTWYENTSNSYSKDTPFGFGVGLSFSTNLGVFSISYGLGKQRNNPIELNNGKVHFGYIAYF